jgi:hypothetical protein
MEMKMKVQGTEKMQRRTKRARRTTEDKGRFVVRFQSWLVQ